MSTTGEPPIVLYVKSLTREAQYRLYASCPWTVRAVLHSLTPCAKQYVMRLLFLCPVDDSGIEGRVGTLAVSRRTLDSWAKEGSAHSHLLALQQLGALGIIEWQDEGAGDDDDFEDAEVLGAIDNGGGTNAVGSGSAVMPSREAHLRLQPGFQRHVLSSLTQDADQPWSPAPSSSPGKVQEKIKAGTISVNLRRLVRHERSRWDALLYYLVTCAEEGAEVPSRVVLELFVLAGLLDFDDETEDVRISRHGYEFVLSEADEQLWSLMQVYIAHRVAKGDETRDNQGGERGRGSGRVEEELISLLFQLAFFAKGMFGAREESEGSRSRGHCAIPVSLLTASQRNVLPDLHDIGVVMLLNGSMGGGGGGGHCDFFLPTPLAATLVFGRYGDGASSGSIASASLDVSGAGQQGSAGVDAEAGMEANEDGELAIVVETNFKVYAYTGTSGQTELHAKLLGLFVDIKFLLPNLIVGTITKESVARALDSGIGAAQMNGFLTKHAHVHARAREPVVPENITDQVGFFLRRVCICVMSGLESSADRERLARWSGKTHRWMRCRHLNMSTTKHPTT